LSRGGSDELAGEPFVGLDKDLGLVDVGGLQMAPESSLNSKILFVAILCPCFG
jgi:hypothetical protein